MKKITSLILVLAMLVSVFSFNTFSVYAEGEESTVNIKNQQTIEILKTLGIGNSFVASYNEAGTMTRRQYCILMKDFLGKSFGSTSNLIPFDDVMDYDPDIAVLRTMSELGFMYGFDDNTFRPDAEVTYEDAITVMVNMLGYTLPAESKGGYPMGYLSVAAQEGLIEGVTPVSGKAITQGDILTLITNFIEIDVLEQVSFGDDGKFQSVDGETILAKHFNVYKGEGILNGTYMSMLDTASALAEDKVQINKSILYVNGTNAVDYFGYNVEYLYEYNKTGISKIISIFPSDINKELVIDASDKESLVGNTLTYYDREKEKNREADIEFNTTMIYNGAHSVFDRDLINNMTEGNLKFLDNNGDGKYDVLFVNHIDYVVVERVDVENKIIIAKYTMSSGSNSIKLEDDTIDVKYSIRDINGATLDISKIKKYDVLSVITSTSGTDERIYKIEVCSNNVIGTITSISGVSGDYDSVYVDDKEYKISETMNGYFRNTKIADFKLGEKIGLILNKDGYAITYLVSVNNDATDILSMTSAKFNGNLGYMIYHAYKDNSERSYCIDFIDNTGVKVETTLADEFKFMHYDYSTGVEYDGNKSYKVKSSDFTGKIKPIIDNAFNASILVFRYELDSEGKICELEIATDASSAEKNAEGINEALNENRLSVIKKNDSTEYRVYSNAILVHDKANKTGKLYRLTDGAVVFCADKSGDDDYLATPDLTTHMNKNKDDNYAKAKFDTGFLYTYGLMDTELVAISHKDEEVRGKKHITNTLTTSGMMIVTKISSVSRVIDEKDEELMQLTGINPTNGKEATALIRDMRSSSDKASKPITFSFGDIIQVVKGDDGFCTYTSNAGVDTIDTYNETDYNKYGAQIHRYFKTTAQGTSSVRSTFTTSNRVPSIFNSGASFLLSYAADIADGKIYLGSTHDSSVNGSSTKYSVPKSFNLGSEKVVVIDSRQKKVRTGTVDDIILASTKFPANKNAAHKHDEATVIFTYQDLSNVKLIVVFK